MILVLGGFVAHQGLLHLWLVILLAFLGTLAGDQLWFFLGRTKGHALIQRFAALRKNIVPVHKLLEKYDSLYILGFRFLYGLRTVSPFIIGTTKIKTSKFIILNIIGAALWAIAFGVLGYLFGLALTALLGRIRHIEKEIILALIIVGIIFWLARWIYLRTRKN